MRLIYDIISDKRDKKELSGDDIKSFLSLYQKGDISDYQMSALLMAVCINGLSTDELATWTESMLYSGRVLEFDFAGPVVDKHSTGGVGDKISIPLAPVLAELGFTVPMISGRGLGHTGGTLDKLESIPGFNVNLSLQQFEKMLGTISVSLIGQTPEIAPLDKKLYALRDVTGTVESIPLIASSIMSKKMAEGIDSLILDVKVGDGAFMKTLDQAKSLASEMISIGKSLGKKVGVIFSNMNEPLGYAIGNALEITESIDLLKGRYIPQVSELTEELAAALLLMHGMTESMEEGKDRVKEVIHSSKALQRFYSIVEQQGGDVAALENGLETAGHEKTVKALEGGYISSVKALNFGKALVHLGGGRMRKEDNIDPSVGFLLHKKAGEAVAKDEPLYTIRYNDEKKLFSALEYLGSAVTVTQSKPVPQSLILETILP